MSHNHILQFVVVHLREYKINVQLQYSMHLSYGPKAKGLISSNQFVNYTVLSCGHVRVSLLVIMVQNTLNLIVIF